MPTVEENLQSWSHYDWSQRGDEWSYRWGGTEYVWWGTVFPRVQAFLPANGILELGPGFGRCTQYLKNFCKELTVVDLVERCIEACKERFSDCGHISYFCNDGKSLNMVPDDSIDFIFSWDSLVHCECDVIENYVAEFARVLKPNGAGFVHHANMGYYRSREDGEEFIKNNNVHWRAVSMSGELFEKYCRESGLQCVAQELIGWGGEILNDCFSSFVPQGSILARPNVVREDEKFMDEVDHLAALAEMYSPARFAEK